MTAPFYVPPEQLMKDRAEYARKGIARGRSIVALEYEHGVLMIGENTSGSLHKISEIYDRIAFAGVGKYNEFEALRVAGVRHADVKGYAYGRSDVTARGLANAYSQTLGQIFTHEVKPYEVEILVIEVGVEPGHNDLFRVTYDGTLYDEVGHAAIGGQSEALGTALGERFDTGLTLDGAIALAIDVVESVEERTVESENWEAAVLDRTSGRRTFQRLDTSVVAGARS
jgi:proteasome alpha subunit